MNTRRSVLYAALAVLVSIPIVAWQARSHEQIRGEEAAILTHAPDVPPPITRRYPTKVIVHLETQEVKQRLADGVEYTFWTFGGQVPGMFVRVRQGDMVEFHLNNRPDSRMPHNIDLHAVTGPGGGAAASFTAPGHSSVFSFTALNPGLYVYHCATAPVGMHIGNGMYGLILVEPKDGLPKVDREYYVMQGEFYTGGAYGQAGHQPFSMQKALAEEADYVVFNGSVGAMTGDRALKAHVGETVRLFVGNGGPNLVSSFHVIGEIFDRVYAEAGGQSSTDIQTTLIPAGGAARVEFALQVPGTYILVDHSIFRAFNKGALAQLRVEGPTAVTVYSGKQVDEIYMPEGGAVQTVAQPATPVVARTLREQLELGEHVFTRECAACHQPTGQGVANAFPPLARSDFLNADKKRAISVVMNGFSGPVTVNGTTYNGVMPSLRLSDEDIANVLTYLYSKWGNSGLVVSPMEVLEARSAH
jgi:nitrite reductase (NO-forming)